MINSIFSRDARSYWETTLKSSAYPVLLFGLAFAVLIFGFGAASIHFAEIEGNVITYFDFYSGVPVFGEVVALYRIFWLAFVLVAMNAFLAKIFLHREPFFSYILSIGSVFVSILIFISMRVIIFLN